MHRWLQPFFALFVILSLTWANLAYAEELQPIPPLTSLVIDNTDTLSANERAQLNAKLMAFEKEMGSQIGILMIHSTQPENMRDYAQRVAQTYRLGRAKIGDGLIFVIAKNDRKIWVYVMRTLEPIITDIDATDIIDDQIKPAFSQGQFYSGLDSATNKVFDLIRQSDLPKLGEEAGYLAQQPIKKSPPNLALLTLHLERMKLIKQLLDMRPSIPKNDPYLPARVLTTTYLNGDLFSLTATDYSEIESTLAGLYDPEEGSDEGNLANVFNQVATELVSELSRDNKINQTEAFRVLRINLDGNANRIQVALKNYRDLKYH